ncbi:unnamed protein product, partial [Discosporangium mesarthrocarpum]
PLYQTQAPFPPTLYTVPTIETYPDPINERLGYPGGPNFPGGTLYPAVVEYPGTAGYPVVEDPAPGYPALPTYKSGERYGSVAIAPVLPDGSSGDISPS